MHRQAGARRLLEVRRAAQVPPEEPALRRQAHLAGARRPRRRAQHRAQPGRVRGAGRLRVAPPQRGGALDRAGAPRAALDPGALRSAVRRARADACPGMALHRRRAGAGRGRGRRAARARPRQPAEGPGADPRERALEERALRAGSAPLRRRRRRPAPGARLPMKILFLTGSLVHGGAERHTITPANRLAERGHECHAAYVKNDSNQLSRYRGIASSTCLDARKYLDGGALRGLRDLIRELNPTHVLAANAYALLYAWLALRAAASPAPLTVTYHTTLPKNAKEWLQMLYYRPLFWSADWLVYVCEAQARYWRRRQLFARKTGVIYNGVDLAHWTPRAAQPLRKILGFDERDLVIGLSAVLRAEKNPVQLVEAVAGARARH